MTRKEKNTNSDIRSYTYGHLQRHMANKGFNDDDTLIGECWSCGLFFYIRCHFSVKCSGESTESCCRWTGGGEFFCGVRHDNSLQLSRSVLFLGAEWHKRSMFQSLHVYSLYSSVGASSPNSPSSPSRVVGVVAKSFSTVLGRISWIIGVSWYKSWICVTWMGGQINKNIFKEHNRF